MISGASKIPRKKRKKLWTQTDPVCTFKIISTIPALLSPVSPTGRTKTAITGRQQQIQHAKKGWVPIRRQIQLKWDTADASNILYAATVQQCWHRLCSSKPALAFYLDGRTGPLGPASIKPNLACSQNQNSLILQFSSSLLLQPL